MSRFIVAVSDNDVENLLDECIEQDIIGGSRFAQMTYEQGVDAALRWVIGLADEHPLHPLSNT